MTVFSPEAAVVSAAASEPAAVVSAAAAVVSVFWLLPHAVKDNAKTAAAPSAKNSFLHNISPPELSLSLPVFIRIRCADRTVPFIDTVRK